MQDLIDFLVSTPQPPAFVRGQIKRQVTVSLTEDEYELLGRLTSHPDTREFFGRKQYEVLRHAFYYYAQDFENLVENPDWHPILTRLKNTFRQHNLTLTRDAINEVIDQLADRTNTLLDFTQVDGAMQEYDNFFEEIKDLPAWWHDSVLTLLHQHIGVERFRSRINRLGLERTLELREIEEKTRDANED
jgi:hypothetical protein